MVKLILADGRVMLFDNAEQVTVLYGKDADGEDADERKNPDWPQVFSEETPANCVHSGEYIVLNPGGDFEIAKVQDVSKWEHGIPLRTMGSKGVRKARRKSATG